MTICAQTRIIPARAGFTGSIAFLWVWRQHIDVFSNGENAKPACQMVTVAYVFPVPLMNVPLHNNLFANIPT